MADDDSVPNVTLRGLAHELRTPLQYIADSARFLDAAWPPADGPVRGRADDARAAIALIEDGARRLTALIATLADIARSDDDDLELEDPNRLVRVALAAAHHELKYRVEVAVQAGDVPMVPCHPGRLTRHLARGLAQAAMAAPSDPRRLPVLQVVTRVDGEHVAITAQAGDAPAFCLRVPHGA